MNVNECNDWYVHVATARYRECGEQVIEPRIDISKERVSLKLAQCRDSIRLEVFDYNQKRLNALMDALTVFDCDNFIQALKQLIQVSYTLGREDKSLDESLAVSMGLGTLKQRGFQEKALKCMETLLRNLISQAFKAGRAHRVLTELV